MRLLSRCSCSYVTVRPSKRTAGVVGWWCAWKLAVWTSVWSCGWWSLSMGMGVSVLSCRWVGLRRARQGTLTNARMASPSHRPESASQ